MTHEEAELKKFVRNMSVDLRQKVRAATLLLDTPDGLVQVSVGNEHYILPMLLKYFGECFLRSQSKTNVTNLVACPNCSGTGEMMDCDLLVTCSRCNGGGELVLISTIEI